MALNIPFDYSNILIGDEISFRALSQQQRQAAAGEFGRTWDSQDDLAKSQSFFQSQVMRTSFNIPARYQHCDPEPPCPWEKTKDELSDADFMPVMNSNDGVNTWTFLVAERPGNNNKVRVGQPIIQYTPAQNQLDPVIQGEFAYFERGPASGYTGPAVVVIKKHHRGQVVDEYYYTFDMV